VGGFEPPRSLKKEIIQKVLPAVQNLLKSPAQIEVFTEFDLEESPDLLAQFVDC
jgi:hypothetical protein